MDTDKLGEIESRLTDKLDKLCASGRCWESAERISRILLNVAALRAIAGGGRVRPGAGGPTVDPPRGRDS